MATKQYEIRKVDNCFLVRTTGDWDLQNDLSYISDLSDALKSRQGKAFYLVVDMRGLAVPDSVKNSKKNYPIHLDRRNQQGEIWLMDDFSQTEHLLIYFEKVGFELKRTTEPGEFIDWLYQRIAPHTLNEIVSWIGDADSSKNNRQLA
ncbi:hypothetical protein [Alteromonas sp. CYL-A6]|uniref:hypothetical protein n=1 Tax=Alteromonas nitratireducens TaxID=3390813 RepID=UPI0034C0119A